MHSLPVIFALLAGCGGSTETTTPEPAVEVAPAPEVVKAPDPGKAWKVLAPSPLELADEVKSAGITASMADLVPGEVPEGVYGDVEDKVAVQTGVLFAYTLLGGRTSEKGVFLTQVRGMRAGLAKIGAGKGLLKTIDRSIEHIQNDTAEREDFLTELDEQVKQSVPEEGWGPDDTTGPLLQAGAWLAGINVVAQAVVRDNNAEAADTLLKRPEVADFFLKYVQSDEGRGKAGSVSFHATEALKGLKEISSRDTIGVEGAKEAIQVTDKLIKLL